MDLKNSRHGSSLLNIYVDGGERVVLDTVGGIEAETKVAIQDWMEVINFFGSDRLFVLIALFCVWIV
ncbi:hypothetical protein AMTR_s00058p00136410 [Amborella trichopoda]|uniref:Uncharacterized protein n=1 Tax=Amborella trichopoda TaxID=13333 RepID=W1P9J0_AMBTC|nr:hypothetical protein AMTR_s00058p00136410 [Amborella trichopoda]